MNSSMNDIGITGQSSGGKLGWIHNLHLMPGYTPKE